MTTRSFLISRTCTLLWHSLCVSPPLSCSILKIRHAPTFFSDAIDPLNHLSFAKDEGEDSGEEEDYEARLGQLCGGPG